MGKTRIWATLNLTQRFRVNQIFGQLFDQNRLRWLLKLIRLDSKLPKAVITECKQLAVARHNQGMGSTTCNQLNLLDSCHSGEYRVTYIAVDVEFLVLSVSKLATFVASPHKSVKLLNFLLLFVLDLTFNSTFTVTTFVSPFALLLTSFLTLLLWYIAIVIWKVVSFAFLLMSQLVSLMDRLLILFRRSVCFIVYNVVLLLRHVSKWRSGRWSCSCRHRNWIHLAAWHFDLLQVQLCIFFVIFIGFELPIRPWFFQKLTHAFKF